MNLSPKMLTSLKESDLFKGLTSSEPFIVIDNSSWTNFDACFVKGLFAGSLRKQPSGGKTPLAYGHAIHAGLESLLRGKSLDQALIDAQDDAIQGGLHNIGDDKRNLSTLLDTLTAWNLENSMISRPLKAACLNGETVIEKSFRIPLGTIHVDGKLISVIWQGRIDLIEQDSTDGSLWIVDHKTTSIMGEKFADDKYRSSQFLGYCYAASVLFPDYIIKGAKINAIATRKNGFEFATYSLPMMQWMIEEWRLETLLKMEQIFNDLIMLFSDSVAQVTRESCCTKYGKCPFFSVCQAHPNMRDDMLFSEQLFETSTWSPVKE